MGGNVPRRTIGVVRWKFETATSMALFAQTTDESFRPPFSKGGTDPTPWGVGRPPPYVKMGGVCLNFELFLVGRAGLKFYWYAPDYSERHIAAGGSFANFIGSAPTLHGL